MDIANIILEYLKILLAAPFLFSLVAILIITLFREDIKALILRIAKIKLPGGTEVSTPQSNQLAAEEQKPAPEPSVNNQLPIVGLPADLTAQQRTSIEQLIRSHIATAYIWEYRYLNYFLARDTQVILDWLISLKTAPTCTLYDSLWLPIIPSVNERKAIINALQAHHLIQLNESGIIIVTPKGREYQEWRGVLPQLTNQGETK